MNFVPAWLKDRRRLVLRLAESQGWRCAYCLCEIGVRRLRGCHGADPATFDHVVPLSRGGLDTAENGVACCRKCNSEKSDKDADYFWRLSVARMTPALRLRMHLALPTDRAWHAYLCAHLSDLGVNSGLQRPTTTRQEGATE